MVDKPEQPEPESRRYILAVLYGLMIGSAVFLLLRTLLSLDLETSLIAGAFFGFALTTFIVKKTTAG